MIAASQPSLASLVNPKDHTALNDNVIGEVFVIEFKESKDEHWKGFKGKRRVRVVDFDHSNNSFLVESTGLDICEDTHNWYSFEIDLNRELELGTLQHIAKEQVVVLPSLENIGKGKYFDNNIIGKTIMLQGPLGDPYRATVLEYDNNNDTHTVQRGDGGVRTAPLNKLLHNNGIVLSSIAFFAEARCHAPPLPSSSPYREPSGQGPRRSPTRISRSGNPAARPMPRGKAI